MEKGEGTKNGGRSATHCRIKYADTKRPSERVAVFKLQSKSQHFSGFSGESGKQLKKIRDNSKHCYLLSEPQSGISGRSGGIRTRGLMDPNHARYQASPHPVNSGIIMNYFPIVKCQPPLFPPVRIFVTPRSYTSPRWFT